MNYLLEKSRVSRQAEFERSYHVFYEMLKGASEDEKIRWNLADPIDYEYLNKSGCIDIDGVNDRKHFEGLKLAMTVLKMTTEDLDSIFQTVSAILWIGNIKFKNDDQTESVTVANPEMVEKVANILAVDAKVLDEALRFRKLTIRGETSNVPIKPVNVSEQEVASEWVWACGV